MTIMDLSEYLQSAQISLFRFEALQEYKIDKDGISNEKMENWWSFIKDKKNSGVSMKRVRLVSYPLNEYTKKELVIHRKSNSFGDDIKIINEDIFKTLKLNKKDFWLIDDKLVLLMNYSNEGEYFGFDIIEGNINSYLKNKKLLLKNSIDL